MGLGKRVAGMKQARRERRTAVRSRRIAVIAYRLYQKRMLKHSSGDEASDWSKAQKIVSSPLRHFVYSINQTAKPTAVLPVRWFSTGVSDKTSWEWMELLLIPLLLAVGAFYLERRQERIAAERHEQEAQIADERYEQEVRIVDERAKQDTLTSYLEQMKELLLSENLRDSSVDSEVHIVARAITATAIQELGSERNRLLISFLKESNLIQKTGTSPSNKAEQLTLLNGLNLKSAKLRFADPSSADLSSITFFSADLSSADLREADLSEANLFFTDLSRASLHDANLSGADIRTATLRQSQLENSLLCGTQLPASFTIDPDRNCPTEVR